MVAWRIIRCSDEDEDEIRLVVECAEWLQIVAARQVHACNGEHVPNNLN